MINLGIVPGADPSPRLQAALETLSGLHIESDVGVCIQSALIVRDYLRALGFKAKVMPVGVVLEASENGRLLHSLGIGVRAALDLPPPDKADSWDGHLVVLVEDGKRTPLLIDPSIGQARRDAWDDLPSMLVVSTIAVGNRHKADGALARFLNEKAGGYLLKVRWFANPGNKGWRSSSGADEALRQPIVEQLLAEARAPA